MVVCGIGRCNALNMVLANSQNIVVMLDSIWVQYQVYMQPAVFWDAKVFL